MGGELPGLEVRGKKLAFHCKSLLCSPMSKCGGQRQARVGRGLPSFFLSSIPAPSPALSKVKFLGDIEELSWGEGTLYKGLAGSSFLPQLSISVPCIWASPGSITEGGHHGVGERWEAAEKDKSFALSASCLQKRNKSGLGGRRPGSLGWGAGSQGCWMCLS